MERHQQNEQWERPTDRLDQGENARTFDLGFGPMTVDETARIVWLLDQDRQQCGPLDWSNDMDLVGIRISTLADIDFDFALALTRRLGTDSNEFCREVAADSLCSLALQYRQRFGNI